MSMARFAVMAAMAEAMMAHDERLVGTSKHHVTNGVHREHTPWEKIQLTKSERKGKTPEEIQALRKQKWEESNV